MNFIPTSYNNKICGGTLYKWIGGFEMKLQRLRDLREDHDLKQTDIADYLHISQRTYSHYETDSRSIPLEQLIRLAIYYETSLDYLANLTDNKKPYPHGKHAPKK